MSDVKAGRFRPPRPEALQGPVVGLAPPATVVRPLAAIVLWPPGAQRVTLSPPPTQPAVPPLRGRHEPVAPVPTAALLPPAGWPARASSLEMPTPLLGRRVSAASRTEIDEVAPSRGQARGKR